MRFGGLGELEWLVSILIVLTVFFMLGFLSLRMEKRQTIRLISFIISMIVLPWVACRVGYHEGIQEALNNPQKFTAEMAQSENSSWGLVFLVLFIIGIFLENWKRNGLRKDPIDRVAKVEAPAVPPTSVEVPPVCPICNLEMDKVTVPPGHKEAGQQFWRCLNFKTCHQWQPSEVQEDEKAN